MPTVHDILLDSFLVNKTSRNSIIEKMIGFKMVYKVTMNLIGDVISDPQNKNQPSTPFDFFFNTKSLEWLIETMNSSLGSTQVDVVLSTSNCIEKIGNPNCANDETFDKRIQKTLEYLEFVELMTKEDCVVHYEYRGRYQEIKNLYVWFLNVNKDNKLFVDMKIVYFGDKPCYNFLQKTKNPEILKIAKQLLVEQRMINSLEISNVTINTKYGYESNYFISAFDVCEKNLYVPEF